MAKKSLAEYLLPLSFVIATVYLVIVAGVIYVAIHFIVKFW